MAKFSYLSSMELTKDKTARFDIPQISVNNRSPVLICRPAGQANPEYFNVLLKHSARIAKAVAAGNVTLEMIEESRDKDRDLFARFVVVGWEDVLDDDGVEVKFTSSTVADLMEALPVRLFDELRNFANDTSNFVEDVDIEITAKNSQSG